MYAKYTTYLKDIMDNEETSVLLEQAMSTYPLYEKKSEEIYMPSYVPTREELNKKILNFYKYREIGFETVGRFLDELEISLNEIMPRYNLLFFTADQDYNPTYNVDYTKTIDSNRDDNGVSQSSGQNDRRSETSNTDNSTSSSTDSNTTTNSINSNSKNVKSDTPQNQLSIPASNIDNVSYASEVDWNKTSSSSNTQSNGEASSSASSTGLEVTIDSLTNSNTVNKSDNRKENIVEKTKGNYGQTSAQHLLVKYRELIINIEQMIIKDKRISELFMRVW